MLQSANQVTIEWGCCRIDNKIVPGTYGIKQVDGESDINKILIKKILKIEEQVNYIASNLNKK